MRTVCFIKHLKVNVSGKVSQNCIALGDIDGDGTNELVVGVSDLKEGTIEIYKGLSTTPWWELNGLGDISCIAIGDVCNQEKNSILAFSWSGQCFILDVFPSATGPNHMIKPFQLIPNISNVLVGDIDNDDKSELVVCHSDKSVSAYRWNDKVKKFLLLQRWKLKELAGNVALHIGYEHQNQSSLMVSQPACSYAVLQFSKNAATDGESESPVPDDVENVVYTQLSSLSRLQNPNISSKILGAIMKSGEKPSGYFALCTLDGTLKLMEGSKNLWSVQLDHQLFALDKLDVLGDNREEVIVCAWDGWTYIVDHDRNVVRYRFPKNVQAFCAGGYCIEENAGNTPCLVYADFDRNVYLYYDVKLPFLRVTNLLSVAENDDVMAKHFAEMGLNSAEEKIVYLQECIKMKTTYAKTDFAT